MFSKPKHYVIAIIIFFIAIVFSIYHFGGFKEVVIINIANYQSKLNPIEKALDDGSKVKKDGAVYLAAAIFELLNKSPNAVITETGDWVMNPSWRLFNGLPEFSLAEKFGLMVGAMGNHEFHQGLPHLKNALEKSTFPLINSNLTFTDPQLKKNIPDNIIINDTRGVAIGFFSLITPQLLSITPHSDQIEVNTDFVKIAQNNISELKRKGADIIVLLSHCDLNDDIELAKKVRGITVIINGDANSEEVNPKPVWVQSPGSWNTPIVLSGPAGHNLSYLAIPLHWGRIIPDKFKAATIDLKHRELPPQHQDISQLVTEYENKMDDILHEPIGEFLSPVDATKYNTRRGETALGNFLADTIREHNQADVALINAGGIRGDTVFPVGPVTMKTILSILPFNDTVWIKNLTGAQLRMALELSASSLAGTGTGNDTDIDTSRRIGSGGFLQISGLKIKIALADINKPAQLNDKNEVIFHGNRLKVVLVFKNNKWESLNDDEIYRVALLNFNAKGGDRYKIFADAPGHDTQVLASEIMIDAIRNHTKGLDLKTDDRISLDSN